MVTVKTIFKTRFGSHLYGTNTPDSDTDFMSVYLPSAEEILLQRVRDSIGTDKKKAEGEKNTPADTDDKGYSLQRYLHLLAQGQTPAIDMLFAPNPEIHWFLWDLIKVNKHRLLTKKSAAFLGYCREQANKYGIKGSRMAAAKVAMLVFKEAVETYGTQYKVGDLERVLRSYLDEHTDIVTKETTQGHEETYFVCCNRMVGFKNTVKEAADIYGRIYENYGERARLALNNEGIDWKALSHAVRVGNEAIELLTTGNITFPLPNAFHILEIKKGLLPYKQVAEEIENLLVEVEAASEKSTLREEADQEWIDNLVLEEYGYVVKEYLIEKGLADQ